MIAGLDALLVLAIVAREKSLTKAFNEHILLTLPELRKIGGLNRQLCKLAPDDEKSDYVYNSSKYRLTHNERIQLQRIAGAGVDLNHASLWSLLTKISTSEVQCVASYVYHIRGPVVKQEYNEAAEVLPDPVLQEESAIAHIFFELQDAWQTRAQSDLEALVNAWGPQHAIQQKGAAGVKRSRAERKKTENVYWAAQHEFLASIDSAWDHCVKPNVEGGVLARFICNMLSIDVPLLDFKIVSEANVR